MLRLDVEFKNESNGFYSWNEQELEDEILECILGTKEEISSQAVRYLSRYREQLISWYPFKENAWILEFGAGFGELTGALCKRASRVVAVEVKPARSEIIKKRWKKYKNLEVLTSNTLNYEGEHKFDYILIHDIIPILKKFVLSENPLQEFLTRIKGYLNDNGIVIIATENRLGLKYFSGAVEEFSQKFFTGINQFDGYDNIKTYSSKELKTIISNAGYEDIEIYYPFPDCNFPTEIFTEEIFDTIYYGGETKVTESERLRLFDEKRMFRVLQREGCLYTFVNSFFIELYSKKSYGEKKILYYNSGDSYVSQYSEPLCIYKENGKRKFLRKKKIEILPKGKRLDYILNDIIDSFWENKEAVIKQLEQIFNSFYKYFCMLVCNCKREYQKSEEYDRDVEYILGMPTKIRVEHFLYDGSKWFQLEWEETNNKVDLEFTLWDFAYSWYCNYILGSKTFEKIIDICSIYNCLHINICHVRQFLQKKSLESKNVIQTLYRDTYCIDVCYAHDVITKGIKIITEELCELQPDKKIKAILTEKNILDHQKEDFENEINTRNKKMY